MRQGLIQDFVMGAAKVKMHINSLNAIFLSCLVIFDLTHKLKFSFRKKPLEADFAFYNMKAARSPKGLL